MNDTPNSSGAGADGLFPVMVVPKDVIRRMHQRHICSLNVLAIKTIVTIGLTMALLTLVAQVLSPYVAIALLIPFAFLNTTLLKRFVERAAISSYELAHQARQEARRAAAETPNDSTDVR